VCACAHACVCVYAHVHAYNCGCVLACACVSSMGGGRCGVWVRGEGSGDVCGGVGGW